MQRLLVFNPGHEEALRYSEILHYTPSKLVRCMMSDLASLMCTLAEPGDYIYQPSVDFREACLLDHQGNKVATNRLLELPPLELCMWALEPHLMKQIVSWCRSHQIDIKCPIISEDYLSLSHRRSASEFLDKLREIEPSINCDLLNYPKWFDVHNLSELKEYVQMLRLQGYEELMLKSPYSSSGRGVHCVSTDLSSEDLLVVRSLKHGGSFSIEPKLSKVQDYSMLLHVDEKSVRLIGFSKFFTSEGNKSAYNGSLLQPSQEVEKELAGILGDKLQSLVSFVQQYIGDRLGGTYVGYLGVDMISYKDQEGHLRLHPCIEINVRCTMGVIALSLFDRLGEEWRGGFFQVASVSPDLRLRLEETVKGGAVEMLDLRLISGQFNPDQHFVAFVQKPS